MINSNAVPSLPVSRTAREKLNLPDEYFDQRGFLKIPGRRDARKLALLYPEVFREDPPRASDVYGAACIVTAWRLLLEYWEDGSDPYEKGIPGSEVAAAGDKKAENDVLREIISAYPDENLWHGHKTPGEALETVETGNAGGIDGRESLIRRWTLAVLSDEDPAFSPFRKLFLPETRNETASASVAGENGTRETEVPKTADFPEQKATHHPFRGKSEATGLSPESSALWKSIETADAQRAPREPEDATPLATLRRPVEAAPDSVKEQLLYILKHWGSVLGDWAAGLIGALDMIEEEQRPRFGGPGPVQRPVFSDMDENARFSSDDDWMPRVVLIAKNILVWLDQLSKNYGREIRTLDAVPDEELDSLASRGFNALWLIGLWERSDGSREIKRRMGNPEAAASAYSLYGYDIAGELGGWEALEHLRGRAASRGIRLSSDMVPNHVGLDSDWVRHHPDRLLSTGECPYPGYSFNSDNLSHDGNVDIRLEDHYWDRSDAAVVFKRTDRNTGEVRYVYHGNDGTTMPWNDTAQIDFLNPEAREAVIQDILHVARNFPIIRFDAAMVLARKHIRRLWYPAPGAGGAIPSRSEYALSDEEFMKACPEEFWREVVDRVAAEVPGTLLLAEAFWMMEGYFVRVLGMHRVYNSAFMNMLRDQKNREYRDMIKETLAFDPRILQRFVNFMNNPDEETAVDQFGNDDRYFAACTLLATLPGLPMFGHGQIEGLSEKYGMEYIRAYKDEQPDPALIERHEREIFPLLEQRAVFAGAPSFRLYDLHGSEGVNENVFAFTNTGSEGRCLVIVNNSFERAAGQIHRSAPVNIGDMKILNENLDTALGLNTASDGDWLLLRDFISNLWYLRSAAELKQNGLSILIDGFGRQIFMDFRVEPETSDGLWGKLAAELKGAGTPDPDAALGEIRLRPLHQLLDTLISADIINRTADIIRRGKSPVPRGSGNFFPKETALTLLGIDRSRSEILHTAIERRMNGSAVLFRFFGGGIRRKLKRLYGLPEWDEAVFLSLWSILFSLKENSDVEAGIWESWGLEKWLEKSGIGTGDKRLFQALKIILSMNSLIEKNSDSAAFLSGLFSLPVIRESCSVNEWDDVLWYSREGWIQLFQVLFPASAADSEPGRKKRQLYRKIRKTMRSWYLADKKASYHLSHLLHAAR